MKKAFTFIILAFTLAVLQSSFFTRLFGSDLNPNFVLAFAFGLFIMSKYDEAYLIGFVGGLFLDFLGFKTIGLSSVSFVSALLISFYIKKYIFKGMAAQLTYVFIAALLYKSVVLSILNPVFSASIVFSGLLTVGMSLIFYFIAQGLLKDEKKYS